MVLLLQRRGSSLAVSVSSLSSDKLVSSLAPETLQSSNSLEPLKFRHPIQFVGALHGSVVVAQPLVLVFVPLLLVLLFY